LVEGFAGAAVTLQHLNAQLALASLSLDGSEMLLRSQRKLHHAFQELIRRQADEVVHDDKVRLRQGSRGTVWRTF
jgi:hypothetical protein